MSKLFNLKKIFKMSSLIMMAILCTLSLTSHESYAATGYQGYAVYRNGVILPGNLQWHAGLMDEPSSTKFDPVVHHSGSGYVKWDSWANFLDGNQFQAVYKPKSNPTSARRDAYVAMGRRLKDEQISYTFTYQIYYDSYTTPTYVYPDDITSIRCDGVVEYVYEYYGDRVYGNDTYWDISKNGAQLNHHMLVTPKSQTGYLTFVSSTAN